MKIFFHQSLQRAVQTENFIAKKQITTVSVDFPSNASIRDHLVDTGVGRLGHIRPFPHDFQIVGKRYFAYAIAAPD